MADALTPEKEKQLKDFCEEWFGHGTSCDPADRPTAEAAIRKIYGWMDWEEPMFVWVDSPHQGTLLGAILHALGDPTNTELSQAICDRLARKLDEDSPDLRPDDSAYFRTVQKMGEWLFWDMLHTLYGGADAEVPKTDEERQQATQRILSGSNKIPQALKDLGTHEAMRYLATTCRELFIGESSNAAISLSGSVAGRCFYGQMDWWAPYCIFPRDYLGVEYTEEENEKLEAWADLMKSCCWWWTYENMAIVSDRPDEIHWEGDEPANRQLHCDGGPAVRFRDDYSFYFLHGVSVPEWLAVTPAEKIDPARMHEIANAEVRREFVRKVGIDRICEALDARVLDESDDGMYQLIELDAATTGEDRWRFLRMRNPSIDAIHVEGVANTCETVDDALIFRIQGTEDRGYRFDDEAGVEWSIHGDVILIPEGETVLKRRPSQMA